MSGTFDPEVFNNMIVEGANETKFTPLPAGVYEGIIEEAKIDSLTIKNGERAGQTVPILRTRIQLINLSDKLLSELQLDNAPSLKHDVWLDVSPQNTLEMGTNKNVQLGKLREAVKMNNPKKPFRFTDLIGAGPLKIDVRQDPQDDGRIFNRIVNVMPA